MTRGFSLYLDMLRFGAAFVVLISHFGYPRFTEGRFLWIRELNLGSDAVVLFFVLSGVVIAFSARHKDPTLSQFAFNRLTRIMSVALPALVLGFLLDRTGAAFFPGSYGGPFYNALPLPEQLTRGLTFSNEWAGFETRLGTNGPYWSLSYEVAYYALFAFAWYLTGAMRAGLLVLGVLLVGVNVLLLMPSWLLGVWVWRRLEAGQLPADTRALQMMILPPVFYAAALALDVPAALQTTTDQLMSGFPAHALRFSDEFLWNGLLGLAFAVHLLGAAKVLKEKTFQRAAAIRWLAGGSFSMYLIHYPVLQFMRPAVPKSGTAMIDDLVLLGLTVAVCLGFAQVFERTLKTQRLWISRLPLPKKKATSI